LDSIAPHKKIFIGELASSDKWEIRLQIVRALPGLATIAERKRSLMPIVRRHLRAFERSASKALQARAKQIRARLGRRPA
jgi:hypothetical protein